MAARLYSKDGYKLPSVTTITGQLDKPALTYWAANCACDYILDEIEKLPGHVPLGDVILGIVESSRHNFRNVSSKALDIGSAVHGAIDRYLKTGQEPQAPSNEVLSAFLAFLEWKDKTQMEPLEMEKTVYGSDYAGTCDLICNLAGKKYLVDYKSSKGIYPEMRYQVAAYRATDPSIKGCGILRLDKETGNPEWKDTSDTYLTDFEVFLRLRDIWWLTHPKYKRP